MDTAEQAERLVETLLEEGYAAQRVRIFAATQNEFVTTYRPVVSFVAEDDTPAAKMSAGRLPWPVVPPSAFPPRFTAFATTGFSRLAMPPREPGWAA